MIAVVAGARPNFVKVAPILRAMDRRGMRTQFVYTLQHEGVMDLSEELGMRHPDLALPHTRPGDLDSIAMALTKQWARLPQPQAVVVVGDVTSTLAAALAATAHGIPVVHVEAGLRSGDWEMPEERNRAVVDRIADLMLCTEEQAVQRLWKERPSQPTPECGPIPVARRGDQFMRIPCAMFVGNVMVDSLRWAERELEQRRFDDGARLLEAVRQGLVSLDEAKRIAIAPAREPAKYALFTAHRPSNVDQPASWPRLHRAINAILEQGLMVVWPVHPRAENASRARSIAADDIEPHPGLHRTNPVSYLNMVSLMKGATLVATDSGGVQEETTALGIPCLTLRENTERPVTVDVGTNTVVGLDPARIGAEVRKILGGAGKPGRIPEGWDGHAAERIVDAIARRYLP